MAKKSYPAPIPPVWNRLSITPERWREYQTFNPSNLGNISYENMSNYLVYDLNKDLINNIKDFKPFLEKDAIGDYSNPIMVQGLKNKMMKQGWALDTKTGNQVALPKDFISFTTGTPAATPTIQQQAITPAATQPVVPATTGKIIRQPGDPKYVAPTNTPPAYTSPMGYPKTPMPYNNALHTNGGVLNYNQQFLDGGPLVDKTNHGKLLNSVYASALGNYYANGGYLGDKGNTQVHTDKAGNTTTKITKPDGTTYIKVKKANGKEYNKTTYTPTPESIVKNPLVNNSAYQAEKLQQSAGNSDWFWGPTLLGGAGLKSAGAIANTIGSTVKSVGATAIPGMASIPGATVGNLVNAGFIANSIYDTPQNVKDWYDVSQGKKDWTDAAMGTAEIGLGLIGSKPGFKSIAQDSKIALNKIDDVAANAYKINPFAEKLNNPNSSYRVAGLDALEDFQNTGVLRSVQRGAPEGVSLEEGINLSRPTPFPSFQKGYADMHYAPKEGAVIFETKLPTYKRGEINPVTGTKIKGSHYAHRVIDPQTGAIVSEIPASEIKAFGDKPHWLKGYQEVSNKGKVIRKPGDAKFDINLKPDAKRSAELDMETFGVYKGNQRVGEVSGNKLSNGDFQTTDIGIDPQFQKQGIGTEVYKQLNKSLPEGNKVKSWGAFVEENGIAPGRNTWQSLEKKGLAKQNEKGIYEMIPNQNSNFANGGQFTKPYSLPEDSFMQGGNNLHNSVYASSMEQYPAPYEYGGPMSRFYASNVEEPATIGKDLAYNNGGNMNFKYNNQFAEGGNLDPLTTFDEGGKHSENPLGGIPQGQNAQGGMNLVEEGETKLNSKDYIFSDTLKVDKDTVAEFNLPKTMIGKTFADASKKMNRPDSRRINDSIEEKAKERDLNALMEAQEVFKEKEVAKKMEEIQSLNPGLFEQMQQAQMAQMQPQGQPSPEEMMMQQGQAPMDPNAQPQMDPAMMEQMAMQQQGVPQQYGGQMSYKCGGSMYDFGGKLGEGIKNYGLGMADTTMSYLGMDNVIKDDQYEGFGADAAKGYARVVGGLGKKVLPMAANMVVPGSGAVISGAQQLGSQVNPQQEQEQIAQMGGMNFKYGGTFDMPRQQMYMPLDHVTEMGGALSIEDQGLQNLENDYRNSIFEGGGGFTAAQLAAQEAEPIFYPDPSQVISRPSKNVMSFNPETMFGFTPTPMSRQEIEPQMYPTMATAANTENNIVPAVANNIVDDYSNRQMLASQEAESMMYPPNAMQYPQGLTYTQANSVIDPRLQDSELEIAEKMLRDASTEEEHAKALEAYQSAVARHDESLKNRNVDLTMNQTPMQAIGSALPIGYNIGMGLFGKPQQLKESDYMQKADIKAPEMNINPQLRATDQSFAQASNAGRNAGAGSEYLAYMSNLNNIRNKGYADLYGQKFNVDSQNAMNAQLQNKAIEGQNLQTKMGIVDYNAKAKAAKTAMLQEGFKQAATLADNSKSMDAQLALMKAIAPDFAGDFKYNTIFDQYKNRTKKQ